jgi:arylsulfatase A-like enzyme
LKFLFLLFDSLNRLAIEPYGSEVGTPNFRRLAERGVTFERHYVGSLPCMPARRDIQTGRASFMHRSWGPLEPFDNSFAQILKRSGVYTHLITDHYHYFEDGGAGYHTKYTTWELMRGQEYDAWKALVDPPLERFRQTYAQSQYGLERHGIRLRHMVNNEFMPNEADLPGPRCFAAGLDFLEANKHADNWFLQLELFDPHEPFQVPDRFRRPGDSEYQGPVLNWPDYRRVSESPDEVREIRANYAALVRMCDHYLGQILDMFDANDMWKDTAILMSTDHGFLLSEHEWWGKTRMPYYEEVTHTPLLFYHPAFAAQGGSRRQAVTQTTDLMPTFLDSFDVALPAEVRGRSLLPLLRQRDAEERVVAFGVFGGPIGVTDGRFVMFHYPPDFSAPGLYEYTLNPQHMMAGFDPDELKTASLCEGFDFTRGIPVLRIDALPAARRQPPMVGGRRFEDEGFALYDLEHDPQQMRKLRDPAVEGRLYAGLMDYLVALDTPVEAYRWYGLDRPAG